MPSKPIVCVIDDDEAARQSLAFLLRTAKFDVETYGSADGFLGRLTSDASCVITDIRMPGMTGIDLLKHLKKGANPLPVIVITGHGDVPLAVEAMKQGAFDFLEKPFDDGALLHSVRRAISEHQAKEKRDSQRSSVLERLATLSPRERQVLDGLVAGLPNKSIAHDLDISPRTVEIYRANTMTKMGASSLSELVRLALIAGVLKLSD